MGTCPRCQHDHPPDTPCGPEPRPGFKYAWERHFRGAGLHPSAYAVAWMLSTYADGAGESARPGIARLVRDTGLSRSAVVGALARLRGAGLIELGKAGERGPRRAGDGSRGPRADTYRLALPSHDAGACSHCRNQSTETTGNGPAQTRNQSTEKTSSLRKPVHSDPENWSTQWTTPDQVTRPGQKPRGYGSHIGVPSAHADNGSATRDRAALSLLAAKIHARHVQACKPSMTRDQTRQIGDYVNELITHGKREPEHVEEALSRWRDLRARGQSPSRRTLDSLLERVELAAARVRASNGTDEDGSTVLVSVECERCRQFHPLDQPCPVTT